MEVVEYSTIHSERRRGKSMVKTIPALLEDLDEQLHETEMMCYIVTQTIS